MEVREPKHPAENVHPGPGKTCHPNDAETPAQSYYAQGSAQLRSAKTKGGKCLIRFLMPGHPHSQWLGEKDFKKPTWEPYPAGFIRQEVCWKFPRKKYADQSIHSAHQLFPLHFQAYRPSQGQVRYWFWTKGLGAVRLSRSIAGLGDSLTPGSSRPISTNRKLALSIRTTTAPRHGPACQ